MESALYTGWVQHRRFGHPEHRFRVALYMTWLDLDEIEHAFRGSWLASSRRPALVRFRRSDYLGDASRPLAACVRDLVQERCGVRPGGPIRMLTQLRFAGLVFNPVTLYYCYGADAKRLEAIVAEVTNTPWNERHSYVLRDPEPRAGRLRARHAKAFHVSPFLPMEQEYVWSFATPGERLGVHVENRQGGVRRFDATLLLERRELDPGSLRRTVLRRPFMAVRVLASIYLHALRLWLRGAPFHPHPRHRAHTPETPVHD